MQMYKRANVQMWNCTNVKLYKCANVKRYSLQMCNLKKQTA